MASRIPVIASLSLLAALVFAAPASAVVVRSEPNLSDTTTISGYSPTVWFSIKDNGLRSTTPNYQYFAIGLQAVDTDGAEIYYQQASVASQVKTTGLTTNYWLADNFAFGEMIDFADFQSSSAPHLTYRQQANNDFAVGVSGYLGLSFYDSSVDNKTHYGWARITRTSNGFTIHEWAYETVGDLPILAGSLTSLAAIPEPATTATWTAAVAGLLVATGLRRRNK